jgi:hypothetical protein
MDEQINKKNIIFVFIALIVVFLFIYKGILLSGEEYYEEYTKFRNQAENQQTFLKKLGKKKADNLEITEDNNLNEYKILSNILQQLDNVKLDLGSLDHFIKNKKHNNVENLEKLKNLNNTHNLTADILNEVIENIQNTNDQIMLENITDVLRLNIESLRSYINAN